MNEDLVLHNAPPHLLEIAGHSLAIQFLEGIQFIHYNLVAHLDLKPANIVFGAKDQLRIIDFDVSVWVPLLESWIRGFQGTKGWVAPEVEQNLDAGYEPIRADLWSTGQVMRHLAKHQPACCSEMIFLAGQLQNSEPQQRIAEHDHSHSVPATIPNPPLELKNKLSVDAPGKGGVKRQCVQPDCDEYLDCDDIGCVGWRLTADRRSHEFFNASFKLGRGQSAFAREYGSGACTEVDFFDRKGQLVIY